MSRKLILTIDSGGIRCIIPTMILVDLDRRLREAGRPEGLHHHVDMVAGCGIGAMILAGLTCPHPTIPGRRVATPVEMLQLFRSENRFVFDSPPENLPGQGPYNSDFFDMVLKDRFGPHTMLTDVPTRLVIPAYDIQNRTPMLFSNIEATKSNFYLWQAVRSACAAPGYFIPAMVENLSKARPRGIPLIPAINGGSIARDPALTAYVEAAKLGWTGKGNETILLSLGAGLDRRPIPYLDPQQGGNHGPSLASVDATQVNTHTELDSPMVIPPQTKRV